MYSKRSPPTAPAGMELPYMSIPGNRGITPSTGSSRLRRYSSMVTDVGGVSIEGSLFARACELHFHSNGVHGSANCAGNHAAEQNRGMPQVSTLFQRYILGWRSVPRASSE